MNNNYTNAKKILPECLWNEVSHHLPGGAHGIPNRLDRRKGLGNAIVPQVAYEILRCIAEIEEDNGMAERERFSRKVERLVGFHYGFLNVAFQKIKRLEDQGMRCTEIVLEDTEGKTAHIDRWGKVTWDS